MAVSGTKVCSTCLVANINPLPDKRILDWSKLKVFSDDKLNATQKLEVALGRVENLMRKGDNAGFQHFSFSHSVFKCLLSQGG